jgi:hypothetical protein
LQRNKVGCTILNDGFGLDNGDICQIDGGLKENRMWWLSEKYEILAVRDNVWFFFFHLLFFKLK